MKHVNAAGFLLAVLCLAGGAAAQTSSPGPAAAPAVSACVERAVGAIQQRYEAVRDLRSRFEQTTRSVALGAAGSVTKSSGVVVFAKPGMMRWSYEEPEPSLVVSDGKILWLYDPTRFEAQRLPVTGGYLSGAAIQFLLGEGDVLGAFRVEAVSCSAEEANLELVPRRPASYEKLRVKTEVTTGELLETSITDLLGNVTTVVFSDVQANLGPGLETFRFDPPEGVRVIDLGAVPGAAGRGGAGAADGN